MEIKVEVISFREFLSWKFLSSMLFFFPPQLQDFVNVEFSAFLRFKQVQ